MDSEPEEGEIRDIVGALHSDISSEQDGSAVEDLPLQYRSRKRRRKWHSGTSCRRLSNSPKRIHIERRSRNSPRRRSKPRSHSTSRNHLSFHRNDKIKDKETTNTSGSKQTDYRTGNKSIKEGQQRSSRRSTTSSTEARPKLNTSRRNSSSKEAKTDGEVQTGVVAENIDVTDPSDKQDFIIVQEILYHDLSSPYSPSDPIDSLGIGPEIFCEEEVIVSSVENKDQLYVDPLEIILIDSTSSSDSEVETEPTKSPGHDDDLEVLELRMQALVGLLDPSKEILTGSDDDKIEGLNPELNSISDDLNKKFTTAAILDGNSETTSQDKVSSSTVVAVDDSEKENELELEEYLLREKLLKDLEKKKQSSLTTTVSDKKRHDSASSKSSSNRSSTQSKPSQTKHTQKAPSSSSNSIKRPRNKYDMSSSISTGHEYEDPTSHSYAPLPKRVISPPPTVTFCSSGLDATTFSVSISQDGKDRKVVPHSLSSQFLSPKRVAKNVNDGKKAKTSPNKYGSKSKKESILASNRLGSKITKDKPSTSVKPIVKTLNNTSYKPALGRKTTYPSTSVSTINTYKSHPTISSHLPLHASKGSGPHRRLKRTDDVFNYTRTIVNSEASVNRYNSPHSSRSRYRSSTGTYLPKKISSLVIPVREGDTSSDDETGDDNDTVNRSHKDECSYERSAVKLPEEFHSNLDTFLKSVRQKASQSQAIEKTKRLAELDSNSISCALKNAINYDMRNLYQPNEYNSSGCEISSTYASTSNTETLIKAIYEKTDANTEVITTNINLKSGVDPESKSNDEVADQDCIFKAQTVDCETLAPANNLTQSVLEEKEHHTNSSTDTDVNGNSSVNVTRENELIFQNSPSTSNVQDELSPIQPVLANVNLNGLLPSSSTARDSPVPTNLESDTSTDTFQRLPSNNKQVANTAAKLKGTTAKDQSDQLLKAREELQMRERLLRVTLVKSAQKLKLTGREKELIHTRKRTTEMLQKVLEKMKLYSDRKKHCKELEVQVQRIKMQLAKVEKSLSTAKMESSFLHEDVVKTTEEALSMRKTAVSMNKACETLGKAVIGDEYRTPQKGADEMLAIIKEVHSQNEQVKKLKAEQSAMKDVVLENNGSSESHLSTNLLIGSPAAPNHLTTTVASTESEKWNDVKSLGLTKYLRDASEPGGIDGYTKINRPVTKAKEGYSAVMVPIRLAISVYAPYESPLVCMQPFSVRPIENPQEPICMNSISGKCDNHRCVHQHLS